MQMLTRHTKLLTLSLILRTMPPAQQSLLMSHLSPDVVRILRQIEEETGPDIEKVDWSPIYESWPELKKILNDCRGELRVQSLVSLAENQRNSIKQYMLMKLGKKIKGPPAILSESVKKIIDKFVLSHEAH